MPLALSRANSLPPTPPCCLDLGLTSYDISNYSAVWPTFGDMASFDALLARAKRLGLRVLLDLVPNHSSDQHPWFIESRCS